MTFRVSGNRLRQAALAGGLLCFGALTAGAQVLSVSGSPPAMRINAAIAGLPPTDATDLSTSYTVKAQNRRQPVKVTAQLSAPMPPGMTLTIDMAPPTGAVGYGPVTLDGTARDVVGDITNTNNQTRGITYTVSATPAAGVVAPQSRTVTLTLTAWP